MGLEAMILVFWMLSFKPTFSLSFTPETTGLINYKMGIIKDQEIKKSWKWLSAVGEQARVIADWSTSQTDLI